MEKTFLQVPPLLGWTIFTALIILLSFLIKREIKRMDDKIKDYEIKLEKESERMNGIEKNYKEEFACVRSEANSNYTSIMSAISHLSVKVAIALTKLKTNEEGEDS